MKTDKAGRNLAFDHLMAVVRNVQSRHDCDRTGIACSESQAACVCFLEALAQWVGEDDEVAE